MRIVELNLQAKRASAMRLQPATMGRLGQVVVLAGPNGAGKSRVLRLVAQLVAEQGVPRSTQDSIRHLEREVEARRARTPDFANPKIEELRNALDAVRYDAPPESIAAQPQVVWFVPDANKLTDPRRASLGSGEDATKSLTSQRGVADLAGQALLYLQHIATRRWEATHPDFTGGSEARRLAENDFNSLAELVQQVVGVRVERDIDGNVTLFGRRCGEAELSPGQNVLLKYAVALHSQGARLDNCILLLDEPEKHLHPATLLEVLDRLKRLVPSGQIWIATHSVHVLAWAEPNAIWHIADGSVRHAGRQPEAALRGLLGNDEQIAKLHSFLGEPARHAASLFANECLLPPTTVDTTSDAQSEQVHRILRPGAENGKLVVVDYGAGKGRILAAMAERFQPTSAAAKLADAVDYVAIDLYDTDRAQCENVIASVYGDARARWFPKVDAARTTRGDNFADVVVLCNVLHEVDPLKWLDLFDKEHGLPILLKQDGYLLIVEDQLMPVGEDAHQYGFLVLQTLALRKLFRSSGTEIEGQDHRGDGRLVAHRVTAGLVSQVTAESRLQSIESIRHKAKQELEALRMADRRDFKAGQALAFWTHQFANASLFLDQVGTSA